MKYSANIVSRADAATDARRQRAIDKCEARKRAARELDPRFTAIEEEMTAAATGMTFGVMRREGRGAVERAKAVITALQRERAELLARHGLPADTYSVVYSCPICNDSGVAPKGGPCDCYRAELRRQAYMTSTLASALVSQTFESFYLNYYSTKPDGSGVSPRERMEKNLDFCRRFAKDFAAPGKGLLLMGATGLGKTHLSTAIAGELVMQGYEVQYDMAANILRHLEDRRFGRPVEPDPALYATCDLLIMDDLGAEFDTAVTMAELFTLINTRLITGRKTIISTNYDLKELASAYTQKLTSRILDGYDVLAFTGVDVRVEKRMRG